MSHAERSVVLLLLGLAVAGHAVRLAGRGEGAAGEALLLPGVREASARAHREASERVGRPLAEGERIDADTAPVEELARLPGIGMRLAKEIVSDRVVRGSFGSLEALDRVRGIGPATLRRLEPFLRFSGVPASSGGRVNLNAATLGELERLPGIGPARARAILAYREKHGPFAEPGDLARVAGIGPVTARRLADLLVTR